MRISDKRQVGMLSLATALLLFAVSPAAVAGATGPGDYAGVCSVQHSFIQVCPVKIATPICGIRRERSCSSSALRKILPPTILGGPCQYKSYPGRAEIISVRKVERGPAQGAPPYDPFEVKFSFRSDGKIEGPFAQVEGKEHLLTLKKLLLSRRQVPAEVWY